MTARAGDRLRELAAQATPPTRIADDATETAVETAADQLHALALDLAALCADMADALEKHIEPRYIAPLLARVRELEARTAAGDRTEEGAA